MDQLQAGGALRLVMNHVSSNQCPVAICNYICSQRRLANTRAIRGRLRSMKNGTSETPVPDWGMCPVMAEFRSAIYSPYLR